jgi:hypothetical protein
MFLKIIVEQKFKLNHLYNEFKNHLKKSCKKHLKKFVPYERAVYGNKTPYAALSCFFLSKKA